MRHYFVDTNIIIDMLANREGFAEDACALFDAAEKKEITIYISSLSYSNIYYIVRRVIGHRSTIEALLELSKIVKILMVDSQIVNSALLSEFTDYEDAIQYFCAISEKDISGIVTRNPKDFKLSNIPILSPKDII